ncbi:Uncharacterised protein [uncultured archaeon]|nr:Uncharacterised protein [uncultured archaeon]
MVLRQKELGKEPIFPGPKNLHEYEPPEGFIAPKNGKINLNKPIKKIDAGQLERQLAVIRDPNSNEGQKLDALAGITAMFDVAGGAYTRSQLCETINTLADYVLVTANSSENLKRSAINALHPMVGHYSSRLEPSDMEPLAQSICHVAKNNKLSETLRLAAFAELKNENIYGAYVGRTQQHFEYLLQTLEQCAGEPSLQIKKAAIDLIADYTNNGPCPANSDQYTRLLDAMKFIVNNNFDLEIFKVAIYGARGVLSTHSTSLLNAHMGKILDLAKTCSKMDNSEIQSDAGGVASFIIIDYENILQNTEVKDGMNILLDLLGSPSYNVRSNMLYRIHESFKHCYQLSLAEAQEINSRTLGCVENESNDYLKIMGITCLETSLNSRKTQWEYAFIYSLSKRIAAISEGTIGSEALRLQAGGLVAACGFFKTELFDTPEFRGIFRIDRHTADEMWENSYDWQHESAEYLIMRDCQMIYKVAKDNAEVPIVKTIFETTGLTYFGEWRQNLLEHLYYDRNRRVQDGKTGAPLPLYYIALTTRRKGVDFFGSNVIKPEYDGMFDVRVVQPGTDSKMLDFFAQTSGRLGVNSKKGDVENKWRLFAVLGHGDPDKTGLRFILGGQRGNENIDGNPTYLDTSDGPILYEMSKFFHKPQCYTAGCGMAGIHDPPEMHNVQETIGENLGGRIWSARDPNGGSEVVYGHVNGQPEIINVGYSGSPTVVCDYRNVGDAPELRMEAWTVRRRQDGKIQLDWKTAGENETESYDVERSIDGSVYDRVGIVLKNSSGIYSFVDQKPPRKQALYRIVQRNSSTATGTSFYTFKFSKANGRDDGTVPQKETELPSKFELQQNYPNPFNGTTRIKYNVPKDSKVVIKIYDVAGREMKTLVDREIKAGEHTTKFDATGLASGIYIYTMQAGDFMETRKMAIVK